MANQLRDYAAAKTILNLQHKLGGFGLTPLAHVTSSANYTLTASYLQWLAAELLNVVNFHAFQFNPWNPCSSTHPVIVDLVETHAYILSL